MLAGTVTATATASIAGASEPAAARSVVKKARCAASSPLKDREILDIALIQNVLAASALSADTGDAAYQTALYTEDAVMDIGGREGEVRGRDAIVSVITDPSHSKLRADGMAHVASPPYVRVTGSRAVAVGYLQIIAHDQSPGEKAPEGIPSTGKWVTWRLTANRWDFELRGGQWQISRRTIRPAPSTEALELLRLV